MSLISKTAWCVRDEFVVPLFERAAHLYARRPGISPYFWV